jgi:hypothetical protein
MLELHHHCIIILLLLLLLQVVFVSKCNIDSCVAALHHSYDGTGHLNCLHMLLSSVCVAGVAKSFNFRVQLLQPMWVRPSQSRHHVCCVDLSLLL